MKTGLVGVFTRALPSIFVLILLCSGSTIMADTISPPVTVSFPASIGDPITSGAVSVAFPASISRDLGSKPVSVAFPVSVADSTATGAPVSLAVEPRSLVENDLAGLWHMDGEWGDSSGNGNHGVAENGAAFSGSAAVGSQAGSFDGSDDHIIGAMTGFPIGDAERTITAWVKTSNSSGNRAIFHYGAASSTSPAQSFGIFLSDGKAGVGTGADADRVLAVSVISDGEWHFVAGVYEGTSTNLVRIYVDGAEKGSAVIPVPATASNLFTIGRRTWSDAFFNGFIDEVAVYKRALTSEQILFHYAAGLSAGSHPAPPTLNTLPAFTAAAQLTLSGGKEAGTSIWLNGKKISAADSLTTWEGAHQLQPGNNVLELAALDAVGRLSTGLTARIFYDNLPPVLASSFPANGSDSFRVIPSVTLNFADAGSGVDVAGSMSGATVANSAGQAVSGSWQPSGTNAIVFTPTSAFAVDTFTATARPVDKVGNRAAPLQVVFSTFDKTPPVTTVTVSGTKGQDGWYSTPASVSLSAADDDDGSGVDRIEFSLNGKEWSNYSSPLAFGEDGATTIYYRAIDKSGNVEASAGRQNVALSSAGGAAFGASTVRELFPACNGFPLFAIDGEKIQAYQNGGCTDGGTWLGGRAHDDALMVKFDGPKAINSMRWMSWTSSAWLDPHSEPKDYYVEYSTDPAPSVNSGSWMPVSNLAVSNTDGTVDTARAFVSGNSKGNWLYDSGHSWIVHDFATVKATALRIRVAAKSAGTAYGPALGEVEVYEALPLKSQTVRINRSGLVGQWKMDGNWNDASVVGNHAMALGGATFSADNSSGSFNGTSSYLEVSNSPTLNPPRITVEAWAKSATSTWTNYGFLASKRDAYILSPVPGSNQVQFYVFTAEGWKYATFSDPAVDITQWHHYAGTFDGATVSVYVDGARSSAPASGSISSSDTGSLYIGWDDGQAGRYLNGYLDDVRIYNRALAETELQEHTAPTVASSEPPNLSILKSSVSTVTFNLTTAFSALDLAATTAGATVRTASGSDVAGTWATSGGGSSGSAVFTPVSPLGDGSYLVTITPTDQYGNHRTASLSFTVDATIPVPPVIDPVISPTIVPSQRVTGTREAGASITVVCSTAAVGPVSYPTTTTWSVELSGFAVGSNTFTVTASDTAGNSASSTGTIVYRFTDTTPPDTSFTSGPANNEKVCADTVTLCWTGTDDITAAAGLQYSYNLDVSAWSAFSTETCHTFTGLSDASHSVVARAIDAAGNLDATPAAVNFSTDGGAPVPASIVTSVRDIDATVSWITSEPATTQVDYGPSAAYGMSSPLVTTRTGNHAVTLTGLTPKTTYHYRVKSSDGCREAVSGDATFTTTDLLYPDLHVTQIEAPGAVRPLQQVAVRWLERNDGTGPTRAPWTDKVFLSTDASLDAEDLLLGEFTFSDGLGLGAALWRSATVTIPSLPVGVYHIMVQSDAANAMEEVHEDNNLFTRRVDCVKSKQLAGPDRIALVVPAGETVTGSLDLTNFGATPLTGITATPQANSAGITIVATPPSTLGGQTVEKVNYSVTARNDSPADSSAVLLFSSAEGEQASTTFAITVKPGTAKLVANPAYLDQGMVRGSQNFVEVEIANAGSVAATEIRVVPPPVEWLSLVSPATIATLGAGEKTKVSLALNPATSLPLGPYTGVIALNAENAVASVGFRFTAVSDKIGALKISAKDEFSYYAEGNPPVTGASVKISNPYDGTVVSEGVTDGAGEFGIDTLAEGLYQVEVRADKHGAYQATLKVYPGQTREVTAFLPRQLVSYTWKVVPVQTEDRYQVKLDAVFETRVPAPVITVEPMVLDAGKLTFDANGVATVNYQVTNHGLIAVHGAAIHFDNGAGYQATPLNETIGEIPAMTTVDIPVRVTRLNQAQLRSLAPAAAAADSGTDGCGLRGWVSYLYLCGEDQPGAVPLAIITGLCPPTITPRLLTFERYDITGEFGDIILRPIVLPPFIEESVSCNCDPAKFKPEEFLKAKLNIEGFKQELESAIDLLLAEAGFPMCKSDLGLSFSTALNQCCTSKGETTLGGELSGEASAGLNCTVGVDENLRLGLGTVQARTDLGEILEVDDAYVELAVRAGVMLDGVVKGETKLTQVCGTSEFKRSEKVCLDITGSFGLKNLSVEGGAGGAIKATGTATAQIGSGATVCRDSDKGFTGCLKGIYAEIGASVDFTTIDEVKLGSYGLSNFKCSLIPPSGECDEDISKIQPCQIAQGSRLASYPPRQATQSINPFLALQEQLNQEAGAEGVCAQVRVHLSQDAVIARSAFNASLDIANSPQNTPIENLRVTLSITDGNGQPANALFGIGPPTLSGVGDVNGGGTIQPGATGTASWLIVPTRDAAPEIPVTYFVGGEFSYTQGGSTVTMPLYPAPVLVKPAPVLALDYFWAKDVYGDDPFTPETEPAEPFSLGLLLRNNGKGVANDFRITSAQPQIVDNEKGLLVGFKIIEAQVNAAPLQPSLSLNLGDINPGATSVALWKMTSSLQGTFTEYKADFVHVDGLGNPRLSLIDTVNIHELVHPVRAGDPADDNRPDFLVNDVPDLDHLPETLYNSTGSVEPVASVADASVTWSVVNGHLEAHVSATVPNGWIYIKGTDPGQDQYRLTRVVRADGREIRVGDNAWTTHRTIRKTGQLPYREHFVHLFDRDSGGSYTLIYDLSDTAAPTVYQVTAVPALGNNRSPSYTFSSSKTGTITYGGSCTGTTTAAVAGNNTVTLTGTDGGPLAEGTYDNCTIIVTDAAGNRSAALSINAFRVDLTPPSIGIDPVTSPTTLTAQTLTGSVEEGASVSVVTDTAASDGAATVDGSTWSYHVTGLVEGVNNITVTARDAAGNSASVASSVTVADMAGPALRISTLGNNATTSNRVLNISGMVFDPSGVRDVTVNNSPIPVGNGSFSHAMALQAGANMITLVATDTAGNETIDTRTITLDAAAPGLTVSAPADNSTSYKSFATVSGVIQPGSNVEIVVNQGPAQAPLMDGNNFTQTVNLADGLNTIVVTATDGEGKKNSLKRTVLSNSGRPTIAVTDPDQDTLTTESSIALKGTVADALEPVTVNVTSGADSFSPNVADGRFEQVLALPEVKTYPVTVKVTETTGAETSVQRNIIRQAPESVDAVTTPTNVKTQTVTGTRSAGTTVAVTCSTGSAGPVSYPSAGTWSVELTALAEGANIVNATFTDVSGQVTQAQAAIVVDTVLPVNGSFVAAAGNSQTTLNWSLFYDLGSGISGYRLVFATGAAPASCASGTALYTGSATDFVHSGLTNGVTYFYRVCAQDKAGNFSTGRTASARPAAGGLLSIATVSPLLNALAGVYYDATLAASGGAPPYSWSLVSGSLPAGLALDGKSGVISGTPAKAVTSAFTIQVTDSLGKTARKYLTLTVLAPTITSTASLPSATLGRPYSNALAVSGGVTPYSWSVMAGALPAGVTLNPRTGVIAGTPTAWGTFNFTVQVADGRGAISTKALRLAVTVSALTISTSQLPKATYGKAYSSALAALGGAPPYRWSITTGALPAGLVLDGSNGTISGIPASIGVFSFTAKVTDSRGIAATKALTLNVPGPSITTTTPLPPATFGEAYRKTLTATGVSPYTWSITEGSLPAGLTLTAGTGLISGTPKAFGKFSFTVQVFDGRGVPASKAMTLNVTVPALVITSTSQLPDAVYGRAYSSTLTAEGGVPPRTWSIAAGTLTPGLALDPASGRIAGIPTGWGAFRFTAKITDERGVAATKAMSITVMVPSLAIASPGTLPRATYDTPYSYVLAATGGVPSYTWSVITGRLPAGLLLDASSGTISGTPTTGGTSNFTIKVTDRRGVTDTRDMTLSVTVPALAVASTSPLPAAAQNTPFSFTLTATGGIPGYTWSLASGTLPAGLRLDPVTGAISGTPTVQGTVSFTVRVRDSRGVTATRLMSLSVA